MWASSPPAPLGPGLARVLPRARGVSRQRLELVLELASAQIRQRDQSTLLGFAWSFLHPLLLLVLLYAFFNGRIGRDIAHYPVFLLVGLVFYTHFSNSTTSAGNALIGMTHLTRDTIFPKALLVVAAVLSSSVEFVVSTVICLAIAVVAGVPLTPAVLLLPLVMLMQGWTVLWLSLLLACAYVSARDTGHLHQVFLRLLILGTPIFYSPEFLGSGPAQVVLLLNPLAHFVQWARVLVLDGQVFPLGPFLAMAALNALATGASLLVFRRCEPSFAERI